MGVDGRGKPFAQTKRGISFQFNFQTLNPDNVLFFGWYKSLKHAG